MLKQLTDHLIGRPRTIFLIDSSGALLTALLLFFVLRNFSDYFGMPETTLIYLAAIAGCFCVYSATCYWALKKNLTPFLRAIGVGNLIYCALTMALLVVHYAQLTAIGLTYFLGEIAIVCGLAYVELNIAKAIRDGQKMTTAS